MLFPGRWYSNRQTWQYSRMPNEEEKHPEPDPDEGGKTPTPFTNTEEGKISQFQYPEIDLEHLNDLIVLRATSWDISRRHAHVLVPSSGQFPRKMLSSKS